MYMHQTESCMCYLVWYVLDDFSFWLQIQAAADRVLEETAMKNAQVSNHTDEFLNASRPVTVLVTISVVASPAI